MGVGALSLALGDSWSAFPLGIPMTVGLTFAIAAAITDDENNLDV